MSTYDPRKGGIDLKRIWRQFKGRLWLILALTAAGALLGFFSYYLYSTIAGGNTVYRISNDYYITLNYEDYPNGPDYYNAYTWDSILRDDPIVDYALTLLPDIDKEQILSSVSGEILGDYRILTVIVKGTDKKAVQEISDAYKQALPHFAGEIDMISHIDVWTDSDIEVYDEYTRDGNAAILGGLIGVLAGVLGLLIYYVTDDGIYSERDWYERYPDIPYFGPKDSEEWKLNVSHILGGEEGYRAFNVSDLEFNVSVFNELREAKGVILGIVVGRDKGDRIDKAVYTLKKQDVNVVGVQTV